MKTPSKAKFGGFTLIELLVVVLIIGILSAIALPQYEKAVEKSRVAEAKIVLKNLANAEELHLMRNGRYTYDIANLDLSIPTATNDWEFYVEELLGGNNELGYALSADRQNKSYSILLTKGYGQEDGLFLCSTFDGTLGDCSIFGSVLYDMESTGWKVVKIP